jgi:MFS family permease
VTLTITVLRHHSPVLAGVAVTGSTLAWTVGAWIQAQLSASWPGRRLVRIGLVIILAGIGGMATVLDPAVPVIAGLAAWTLAGLGMGVGYAPTTLMMLREAPPGREGWASASLNLADVLGTATGIGVGGAAVAAAASLGPGLRAGVGTAFVISGLAALAALALAGRLPAGPVSPGPANKPPRAAVAEAEQLS